MSQSKWASESPRTSVSIPSLHLHGIPGAIGGCEATRLQSHHRRAGLNGRLEVLQDIAQKRIGLIDKSRIFAMTEVLKNGQFFSTAEDMLLRGRKEIVWRK